MSTTIEPVDFVGPHEVEQAASFHTDQMLPKSRKHVRNKKVPTQKSMNTTMKTGGLNPRSKLREIAVEAYDPYDWY